MFTDDPVRDFARHDAEQEELLSLLPVCCECGHHIQDEYCYEINDEYVCEECIRDNHRKDVENLMG